MTFGDAYRFADRNCRDNEQSRSRGAIQSSWLEPANLRRLAPLHALVLRHDGRPAQEGLSAGVSAPRGGAFANGFEPALQVRKCVEILLPLLIGNDPRIAGHVRYGV